MKQLTKLKTRKFKTIKIGKEKIKDAILIAEEQIKQGKTVKAIDVFSELEEKYDF